MDQPDPNSADTPDTSEVVPGNSAVHFSIIVPAHDEEALIAGTLEAIHDSFTPLGRPYEVIVAADGCTDATAAIAAGHGAIVVTHERRQIAATRNLGARTASGQVLVFVDADTRVNPLAIEQMIALIDAGAVAGGAPFLFDGPMPRYLRILLPLAIGIFRLANLAGGAFMFSTREAFDAAGGWDERFYAAEEIDLARRLKRQGRFRLIRQPVTTSGRKVRTHSLGELLSLFLRGGLMPWTLKDRSKLGFFYGKRRIDPME